MLAKGKPTTPQSYYRALPDNKTAPLHRGARGRLKSPLRPLRSASSEQKHIRQQNKAFFQQASPHAQTVGAILIARNERSELICSNRQSRFVPYLFTIHYSLFTANASAFACVIPRRCAPRNDRPASPCPSASLISIK